MTAETTELLLLSHTEGDESSFRKAGAQLARVESRARHVCVADEIRALVAKLPETAVRKQQRPVVDIAAARAQLADTLGEPLAYMSLFRRVRWRARDERRSSRLAGGGAHGL